MSSKGPENRPDGLSLYGGQAFLDGVLFRGRRACAIAVRGEAGAIVVATRPFGNESSRLTGLPGVRGLALFLEGVSLSLWGIQQSMDLLQSNSAAMPRSVSKARVALVVVLGFGLAGLLFAFLPNLLAEGLLDGSSKAARSGAEGLLRVGVLVGYGFAIGRLRPIQGGFAYHGAEHMVGQAAQRNLPLAVDTVRDMPRTLPWCGTTMILLAVLVAGALFPAIDLLPRMWSLVVRMASIPLIFAVSVELLFLLGPYQAKPLVRILFTVSQWLQRLTTRRPSDAQIEVAIQAFLAAQNTDRTLKTAS